MKNQPKLGFVNQSALPMNLPLVAADVRRRTLLEFKDFRLVTSAATVQGFKARTSARGILTLLFTVLAMPVFAQVANEGLANGIIAARQQNGALMKQYSWNCRTELSENGTPKDTRVDTVTFGPDGQPQHTTLSDQSNPLPSGFLRKKAAEDERAKLEKYLGALRTFLHQYTLPTAGAVINFISTAPIIPGPGGTLQISGGSVVVPGDTVSITLNAPTRQTTRMTIMTTFQGDDVTVTATFKTLASGLNYAAYIQINVPDKNLTLLIQNYDYINQNN